MADLTVRFVLLWLRVVATYRVYLLFAYFEYLIKQIHSNDGTYLLHFNDALKTLIRELYKKREEKHTIIFGKRSTSR